jgi:aromatic-L-amino-acid/L-tryptophan decarboxylase
VGGGDPWYCNYGIDLSHGFRALKVWVALRHHGREELGKAIARCCSLADQMGRAVAASPALKLARPVISNVCCFSVAGDNASPRNTAIAVQLQLSGDAVFSTTKIDGQTVLRAAIVNHRTTPQDIAAAIAAVEHAVATNPARGA